LKGGSVAIISGSPSQSSLTFRRPALDANGTPVQGTPLYYVDGVSRGHNDPGVKNEDIQNITVLSNPDPATYGEDGKNGVIFIDTKEYMNKHKVHEIKISPNTNTNTNSIVVKDGNPLYVVDGKRSDKEGAGKIAPGDIESVNVLKDDAAISKYGKDGANGVVEIKLKAK
jgi:TonB-dependent SusC/RagA subfamily outer membrane receptor